METDDLKNIWNTLADNDIVAKSIAKENIKDIINKKGVGVLAKKERKIKFENLFYLALVFIIPPLIVGINYFVHKAYPPFLQVIGVMLIEGYFILMYLKTKTKLRYIRATSNSSSLKENVKKFKEDYLVAVNSEAKIGIVFGYILLTIAAIQFFIYKGSFLPIDFSDMNTLIIIFIVLMMILLPTILKLEGNMRHKKFIDELDKTIKEFDEEE